MKTRFGNMWAAQGVHVVTSNSYIRADGALVMGRGAALEAKVAYPDVEYVAGELIISMCGKLGEYGFIPPMDYPVGLPIGLFQVKRHFSSPADLNLIRLSTSMLAEYAKANKRSIHLNYPGIGAGRLSMESVAPIIEVLPDNVYVWRYGISKNDSQ